MAAAAAAAGGGGLAARRGLAGSLASAKRGLLPLLSDGLREYSAEPGTAVT